MGKWERREEYEVQCLLKKSLKDRPREFAVVKVRDRLQCLSEFMNAFRKKNPTYSCKHCVVNILQTHEVGVRTPRFVSSMFSSSFSADD